MTKVEGTGSGKYKMAAFNTDMHISQLPDKERDYDGYTYDFGIEHPNGTSVNTGPTKWKKPKVENTRWRPIPLYFIYLSSQTR